VVCLVKNIVILSLLGSTFDRETFESGCLDAGIFFVFLILLLICEL